MKQKTGNTIWIAAIIVCAIIGIWIYFYYSKHFFILYLSVAGIIAGLVNYYYVFLNLPVEPEPESGDKPRGLMAIPETPWEQPHKTYWLALSGYLIIGVAGAFLTPLMDALVTLKGQINTNHWVLLGYGIVFGFGANRLMSNVLGTVLSKLSVPKPQPVPPPNLLHQSVLPPGPMNLFRLKAADIPADFSDLVNVPGIDTNFIKGVDISHHNGQIPDWNALKEKRIKFVIIKVSEGVGSPDNMAQTNAVLAKNNGFLVGYYHFGRPDARNGGTVDADATAEATEFFSRMQNLPASDLPLMLDLENTQSPVWDSPLNPGDYLKWINTYYATLISLLPESKHMIYSRKNYLEIKLPAGHNLGNKFGLWLSRYNDDYNKAVTIDGWNDWNIWQFSGDAAMIGINPHPFDLNLMRV